MVKHDDKDAAIERFIAQLGKDAEPPAGWQGRVMRSVGDFTESELDMIRGTGPDEHIGASVAHRLVDEIRRHREVTIRLEALATDLEADVPEVHWVADAIRNRMAIADRVALQLASAAPVLSAEDRRTFENLRDSDGRTTARERAALDRLLGASR